MLFGRKKKDGSKQEAGKLIADFFAYQAQTEDMKNDARRTDQTIAVLHPEIPMSMGSQAGWFGGQAALPEGFPWPESDGEKLIFVGQVNLSALPAEIWSGLGPRSGWLGFFLPSKWPHQPTVLHFDGPLVETKGPLPNSAEWARSHDFKAPQTFALPRWPIMITRSSVREYLSLAEQPNPRSQEQGSLLDPAFHPYDGETVSLLLEALNVAVTGATQAIIRFPHMKKLRDVDADWFERSREVALTTFVRFLQLEGQIRAVREPDAALIAGLVSELTKLETRDFRYLRDDEEGFCEFELLEGRLLDQRPVFSNLKNWWYCYEAGLKNHALLSYTGNSTKLPPALRERLEAEWRKEALTGLGAMGHAPAGHIYTPHGPNSPNEVLLELHTRQMAGWIWGDCYSLVMLIDRQALARGDFSEIQFDITN